MPIQAVESQRLYRQIADQLAGLIESGEYRVGDRLPPERVLAEQLKVSRSSVREALIALEVEGCVEIRGGTGVFVIERDRDRRAAPGTRTSPGPFEILDVRHILEPEATALAARHATESDVVQLEAYTVAMSRAETGSDKALEADRNFHVGIARIGGNSALTLMIQTLWELREGPLYVTLEQHFQSSAIWRQAIDEHRSVLEAIRAHDVRAARAAMSKHVKNARTRFASTWKADQE
jgi:GntR family transcriptional regulator, transcriptional repressor for pyruvate dehydrogenase complex